MLSTPIGHQYEKPSALVAHYHVYMAYIWELGSTSAQKMAWCYQAPRHQAIIWTNVDIPCHSLTYTWDAFLLTWSNFKSQHE